MATIAISEIGHDRPFVRVEIALPAFVLALVRRRGERRALARLSRLPDRLVRDAGFDPDAVRDAVSGTWDEVNPGRYRHR
jgi:hypothetical protein